MSRFTDQSVGKAGAELLALSSREWKFMNGGLLVTSDESEVLGTFTAARESARKQEIRCLVQNAERMAALLRAFVGAAQDKAQPSEELIQRALCVLTGAGK